MKTRDNKILVRLYIILFISLLFCLVTLFVSKGDVWPEPQPEVTFTRGK